MTRDILDRVDHAYRIAILAQSTWGWPAVRWPEDARQEIALVALEYPELTPLGTASRAMGRLARKEGYHRVDGVRTQLLPTQRVPYILDSARKRAARMKVPPERRREIARMGALARAAKARS
jgi:hypothetical protein